MRVIHASKRALLLSGISAQTRTLQIVLLLCPREHQIWVPRSFGASVQLTSAQAEDCGFGAWKFCHKIRMGLCDGFPPAPQLCAMFESGVGETSLEDS